jgi:negative regulator of flagellin synthesis FlgM
VSLTDGAARLKRLEQALSGVPVVDQARVAAIKELIHAGRYEVDAEKVAQKLLNFEQALGGASKPF